jgi:ParB-like chromosome segregation protein Spo0J
MPTRPPTLEAPEAAAVFVPLSSLREWEHNPRKNDGRPVEEVAASIKRFGWGAPILARRDGTIIAGHTRAKAAALLGLDVVPVRYLDLDPTNAQLLALADNRLNELAEWDDVGLRRLLSEMDAEGVDIGVGLGWTQEELERLIAPVQQYAVDGTPTGEREQPSTVVVVEVTLPVSCAAEAVSALRAAVAPFEAQGARLDVA